MEALNSKNAIVALNCRSMNVSIKLTVDLCNEQNLKNS